MYEYVKVWYAPGMFEDDAAPEAMTLRMRTYGMGIRVVRSKTGPYEMEFHIREIVRR